MGRKIQAIRGMNDILPPRSADWARLEQVLVKVAREYGYQEIRFPLVEHTELFARSIGESTDVVEKEMYTFVDRSGESLTLRPEGTACCIRAGIEHGLFYNQIQRLFYYGPMFRHERPQRGRYRQFHQFGIEAYGLSAPAVDLEILLLARRIWQELDLEKQLLLQINTLGNAEARALYIQQLVKYFSQYSSQLDEDSQRRLLKNPLRVLDSKNPDLGDLIENAPQLLDYLDDDSRRSFDQLIEMLEQVGCRYRINPRLVRGLDYYNATVFEWTIEGLDGLAQNAVCAGGHYDALVQSMGGRPTPAMGFAIGMERLLSLLAEKWVVANDDIVYVVVLGPDRLAEGMNLADTIRRQTGYRVLVNCNEGDLGLQLKRAHRLGARVAIILGASELPSDELILKYMQGDRPQQRFKISEFKKIGNF